MRDMALGALVLALLGTIAAAAHGADGDPLQGRWTAVDATRDGAPANDLLGHVLTFDGNRFEIADKTGRLFSGTFRVATGSTPATIDFAHDAGGAAGTIWTGVWRIDGDRLSVVDNAPDPTAPRPTSFAAAEGSRHVHITFAR